MKENRTIRCLVIFLAAALLLLTVVGGGLLWILLANRETGERYYLLVVCDRQECRVTIGSRQYFRHSDGDLPQLAEHPECRCAIREQRGILGVFLARRYFSRMLEEVAFYAPAVFCGFEADHYQLHDPLITRLTKDFNTNKMHYADCTAEQVAGIADLDPNLLKALLLQESGGSPEAWRKDPGQVNVPGDWNPYKAHVGLRKPVRRNEGNLERNVEATLKILVRKGFGVSAQPAKNRPEGYFDSWELAIQRYNGRSDRTADGQFYKVAYCRKIMARAAAPGEHVPIMIDKRKKSAGLFPDEFPWEGECLWAVFLIRGGGNA